MKMRILGVAVALVMTLTGAANAAECDLKLGKKSYKACAACHKLDPGKHGIGPSLHGILDRPAASVDGFKYSKGMKAYAEGGAVWDVATLDRFLTKPKKEVKGTKMSYGGLKKEDRRAALICYLATVK